MTKVTVQTFYMATHDLPPPHMFDCQRTRTRFLLAEPLSPNAFLILVTNPSDVMAQVALHESGFAPEKVIGLRGVLVAEKS
ncbi:hypothetical protein [Aneurinibacillus terranovensis]|uniref:hypothetical protein n=1 Tax=Aneurinibacillus terranovensis TaxID=278991 RepID=UPI0009D7512C|nr:hypothetical protein [Aneurinibacillus terranovensis]